MDRNDAFNALQSAFRKDAPSDMPVDAICTLIFSALGDLERIADALEQIASKMAGTFLTPNEVRARESGHDGVSIPPLTGD